MKILMQDLKEGKTTIEEMPVPVVRSGHCLVRSVCSTVSPGTEKMLLEFGKAGYLGKIMRQPDKFRQVLRKARQEGILSALEQAKRKLEQAVPLGYSCVGRIAETGDGVEHFAMGDRVVSNGYHAEYNLVPKNLICRIPDPVSDDEAAFAQLGAIALQGIRLLRPEMGERVVVMGLGLIGILAARLLQANGCKVVGIDPSQEARDKAAATGIPCYDNGVFSAEELFRNAFDATGADAVLIAAASEARLVDEAAVLCRKRGRIVLVGVEGGQYSRDLFYKKELSFQVSCSYGPGRYDPAYEEGGNDYPMAYVRWTEQRNVEAVLGLMAEGKLPTNDLLIMSSTLDQAVETFYSDPSRLRWGNVIRYVGTEEAPRSELRRISVPFAPLREKANRIGYIGSGAFSSAVALPALHRAGASLHILCSSRPEGAGLVRKYGFRHWVSDPMQCIEDPEVDLVCIANRHHRHAALVVAALRAGKQVFVEKPPALNEEELNAIREAWQPGQRLVVGYNRRHSRYARQLREYVGGCHGDVHLHYLVHAGYIPADHWIQDPEQGGGRLIGECGHFLDLAIFLNESSVESFSIRAMGDKRGSTAENFSALLRHCNGNLTALHYICNGPASLPKERITAYFGGKAAAIDNFRRLQTWGIPRAPQILGHFDKGHDRQFREWLDPGSEAYSEKYLEQVFEVSTLSFAMAESLRGVGTQNLQK
ncbi:MAG: bi-domain-containing oxidoreductase [Saprospiraceae bacterium]|nr:bi-domain-containing oxidoreductase [Saprospiraceae bacterium]